MLVSIYCIAKLELITRFAAYVDTSEFEKQGEYSVVNVDYIAMCEHNSSGIAHFHVVHWRFGNPPDPSSLDISANEDTEWANKAIAFFDRVSTRIAPSRRWDDPDAFDRVSEKQEKGKDFDDP